ncbi:MAG: GNAT family N-acetyltransferase [Parvibaculaceae bacterium]
MQDVREKDAGLSVEAAGPDDIEAIIALIRQAHAESRYADYPFAQVRLRRYTSQVLGDTDGRQARVFLAKAGGRTVGMAAASATPLIYSTAIVVSTMLFFVEEKYRGGSAPARLLAALTAWAREKQAVELSVHVTRGLDEGAERINAFFRAKGFEASGENLHLKL